MPVKIYVSHDAQGRPDPTNRTHEVQAAIDIIRKVWLAFNHQKTFYVVIANLHWPNADLVIISERGLGVIELKHYYGRITQRPGRVWYAESMPIQAGSENQGYRNPHEQVQAYACQIREKLMDAPLRDEPWLPRTANDWLKFKIGTAVCFTHPNAIIEELQDALHHHQRSNVSEWEIFTILKPEEVPTWAAALTFEVETKQARRFASVRLNSIQITRIVTDLLKGIEWTEIMNLMPVGEPYAYLNLIENQIYTMTFGLDHEKMVIGRDPKTCNVLLPERLQRISREHASITRTIEGVYIEDLNSLNGTYINGCCLHQRWKLKPGQQILFGGPTIDQAACTLEFSLEPKVPKATAATNN